MSWLLRKIRKKPQHFRTSYQAELIKDGKLTQEDIIKQAEQGVVD